MNFLLLWIKFINLFYCGFNSVFFSIGMNREFLSIFIYFELFFLE